MERRKPLQADPGKAREWQRRGAARYAERRRQRLTQPVERPVDSVRGETAPQMRSGNRKRRRNDAGWRNDCLDRRGRYCRACAASPRPVVHLDWLDSRLEVDHIWPRGQGGPSVVENGLVSCGLHHRAKTESRLLIEFDWLDADQVAWLAAAGWVAWDDAGLPYGRGFKHFAAKSAA